MGLFSFERLFFHGKMSCREMLAMFFTENDEKLLALPGKALESLSSQPCDPKEVVLQLKHKLQLDQASLEQPDPGTKRLIHCLATKAKQSNRLDVVKQLREITPAGTTGKVVAVVVF